MAIAASAFAKELYGVVAARHSKDHPVIGMIEHGELTHEQLLGFAVQFYQLFPKVFPKPIAALYARCPDDHRALDERRQTVRAPTAGMPTGRQRHRREECTRRRHR